MAGSNGTALTDDQRRLLAELAPWQILALADMPDYWCKHIRDGQGSRSVREGWPPGHSRETYPWGLAITLRGDSLHTRKASDPAHAVTLTWAQITRWAEALPAELRADARRNRKAGHDTEQAVAARIIAHHDTPEPAPWEQLDLFELTPSPDRPERK